MAPSRRIMYLVWSSFLIFGVLESLLTTYVNALSLLHGFLLIVGAVFWCGFHAEENELRPPNGAKLLCVLLPIIGVPYYLIGAFGFKKGGLKVACFLAFLAICSVTYLIPVELIQHLSR